MQLSTATSNNLGKCNFIVVYRMIGFEVRGQGNRATKHVEFTCEPIIIYHISCAIYIRCLIMFYS